MSPPEDLYVGNSSQEPQDRSVIKNHMLDDQSESEESIKSAIGRIRSYVRSLLSEADGTEGLKKVLRQVAQEKNNKGEKMETTSEQKHANTIRETVLDYSKKSIMPATREIPPSLSDPRSEESLPANSPSMSLVDSSMTLLHGAMKDLLLKENENPERRLPLNYHNVQTAVKCASEIGKLMKIKIDAHRLKD